MCTILGHNRPNKAVLMIVDSVPSGVAGMRNPVLLIQHANYTIYLILNWWKFLVLRIFLRYKINFYGSEEGQT